MLSEIEFYEEACSICRNQYRCHKYDNYQENKDIEEIKECKYFENVFGDY